MFDHLDVAQRRYQMLRMSPAAPASLEQVKEISLWLEHDVCRIVDELTQRPKFRDLCQWPLRHLASGADSQERRLVEAVDETLVNWAAALAKVGRTPAVQQAVRELDASVTQASASRGHISQHGSAEVAFAEALSAVEYVARRPWRDLVAIADYFGPTAELNLVDRGAFLGRGKQNVQIADFLPSCNPRLRRLGDYVSRTLLVRVDYWREMLGRFASRCHQMAPGSDGRRGRIRKNVQDVRARLVAAHEALQAVCTGPIAGLRSSCAALLQVYVAYRPGVKLPWFGLPSSIGRRPYWVRRRLERQQDIEIAECATSALIDVAPLYREPLDVEAIVAEQVQARELVLLMGPGCREAYWHGELIQANWFARQASWGLIVALAQAAKSQLGVDAFDHPCRSYKDARHRLKPLIPQTLDSRILSAGRGTYRLDLTASAICLLEFDSQQRLVESGMS